MNISARIAELEAEKDAAITRAYKAKLQSEIGQLKEQKTLADNLWITFSIWPEKFTME